MIVTLELRCAVVSMKLSQIKATSDQVWESEVFIVGWGKATAPDQELGDGRFCHATKDRGSAKIQ